MRQVDLKGLQVTVEKPVQVAEGVFYNCWFPQLARFSTGELLASVSMGADAYAQPGVGGKASTYPPTRAGLGSGVTP